jgi:hypothetical protein
LHRIVKRKLVIGGVALALAAFAGGAYAATQTAAPDSRQAFLDDVAKRLHVTPQQLSSALNGAFQDQLQAAVKAGRLTQVQANALAQRLKQKGEAPAVPLGPFGPHFARPGLPGRGFGAFGGPPGGFAGPVGGLASAASYLGISDTKLFQELSQGKSLAQIATASGKTVSGLEQALTTAVKTRLDKLVASKAITSAQANQILSRYSARLSQLVNQKGVPFKRLYMRPPGGAPMPRMWPMPEPGAAVPAPSMPAPGAAVPLPVPAPTA